MHLVCHKTNRHDPRSKRNRPKSEHSECQRSWGSGAVFAPTSLPFPPARVLGGGALKKCLGSKEHPDWFKIDLIAAEIITDQKYKRTKN